MTTGNFFFLHESASIRFLLGHASLSTFVAQVFPGLHQPAIQIGIDQIRVHGMPWRKTLSYFGFRFLSEAVSHVHDKKVKGRFDGVHLRRTNLGQGSLS